MNERRIKIHEDNLDIINLIGPKYTWARNGIMNIKEVYNDRQS